MTLLDQYLKSVSVYLPGGPQREDIVAELAEHLRSKMEDREAVLGRSLTELEQEAILADHGDPILDPDSSVLDPDQCDSAVLHSISSCQPGLRGFAFGNALIARVLDELRVSLPRLRTVATLSPIPGFRRWLSEVTTAAENPSTLADMQAVEASCSWPVDATAAATLERRLVPLCAHYLLHAKDGCDPVDSVARFHLSKGARLRRINWLGDVSRAGMERSFGLMANYVYRPTNLERNHQAYARDHKVNATRQLERLSRRAAEVCGPPSGRALPIPA